MTGETIQSTVFFASNSIPLGNPQHSNQKRKYGKVNKAQLYKQLYKNLVIKSQSQSFSKVEQKCSGSRFCNCRKYQIRKFNCRKLQKSYTYSDTKVAAKHEKTATEALLLRFCCGVTGNRTRDTRIFSPLLYQLSYDTSFVVWDCKGRHFFFTCKFFCINFSKICIFHGFWGEKGVF